MITYYSETLERTISMDEIREYYGDYLIDGMDSIDIENNPDSPEFSDEEALKYCNDKAYNICKRKK